MGIDSFQRVTGSKVDTWLVKTVGVLVTVIGAVLALAEPAIIAAWVRAWSQSAGRR